MNEFITTITSFPVIVFTFLLVFMCLYWLLVIFGAMDLEVLDFGGLDDIDIEAGEGVTGLSGLLASWGLSGVPVTIVASMMTSLCWLMTSIITSVIFPHIASPQVRFLAGLGLIAVVLATSIPLTAKMIRPMRRFFRTRQAVRKSSFIGEQCLVKTLKVTNSFGQGEISDGEAGILVDIVANEPNDIKKDDVVILVDYDEDKEIYYVAKS